MDLEKALLLSSFLSLLRGRGGQTLVLGVTEVCLLQWHKAGHMRLFWPPRHVMNLYHKKQQLGSIIAQKKKKEKKSFSIKSPMGLCFTIVAHLFGIWLYHRVELSRMTFPWCKICFGNSNSPHGTMIRLNGHKRRNFPLKKKVLTKLDSLLHPLTSIKNIHSIGQLPLSGSRLLCHPWFCLAWRYFLLYVPICGGKKFFLNKIKTNVY